jgi:hypothetical protein
VQKALTSGQSSLPVRTRSGAASSNQQYRKLSAQAQHTSSFCPVQHLQAAAYRVTSHSNIFSVKESPAFLSRNRNRIRKTGQRLQSQTWLDIWHVQQAFGRQRLKKATRPSPGRQRHRNRYEPAGKEQHIRLKAFQQAARLPQPLEELPKVARQSA